MDQDGKNMSTRHFWKYNGVGNDFIILWKEPGEAPVSAADAIRLCDRKSGVSGNGVIGADGILELSAPTGAVCAADVRMRIVNSDGTEAEMCGNGLRCAALFLKTPAGSQFGNFEDTQIGFETGGGYREARLIPDGGDFNIEAFMGPPILNSIAIPLAESAARGANDRFIQRPVEVAVNKNIFCRGGNPACGQNQQDPAGGCSSCSQPCAASAEKKSSESAEPQSAVFVRRVIGTAVSMGNPHFVLLDPPDLSDDEFAVLAPLLEKHPLFPNRTNVELLRPISCPVEAPNDRESQSHSSEQGGKSGIPAFRMTVWEILLRICSDCVFRYLLLSNPICIWLTPL